MKTDADPCSVPTVREEVATILGWPTDIVSVDHPNDENLPHTILFFVPGNPGCIGWYIPTLVELVKRLGRGFAARGISYPGHSPNEAIVHVETLTKSLGCHPSIPWTVDGQVLHKCAFMDHVLSQYRNSEQLPKFIFLSHSIGAHMVERLCVIRPDILSRTIGVIHLMPFTRMKAPPSKQKMLDMAASRPDIAIATCKGFLQVLSLLPNRLVDTMSKPIFEDEDGRDLALRLLKQPEFAKNHLELGLEEIRDVPETVDTAALRLIGKQCPVAMLYCGEDHWGPEFHQVELRLLQEKGVIPNNISITYIPELRHAYVCYNYMVPMTVEWCLRSIKDALAANNKPRSRL